jgi:hypothetical protein
MNLSTGYKLEQEQPGAAEHAGRQWQGQTLRDQAIVHFNGRWDMKTANTVAPTLCMLRRATELARWCALAWWPCFIAVSL